MTRRAVHAIAAAVTVGMTEEEARASAGKVLVGCGLRRGWHQVLVRFGRNTTLTFGAPSTAGVRLGENDIFFVDIGPIWEGCEGDAGETFVTGNDAQMHRCREDARRIFHLVRRKWLNEKLTGKALYEYASRTAAELGWTLNLDLSGHRLSEFPHSAHYDGTLAEVGFVPRPFLWVLEIQIRHPEREFGAFFEDLLLEDQYYEYLTQTPSKPAVDEGE